jgi:Ras family protein
MTVLARRKTALCMRFCQDQFSDNYLPTFSTTFSRPFRHNGQDVEVIIKDTQGIGEQEIFRNEYGLGSHGYVLVYSITSQRSFEVVKAINDKLSNLVANRNLVPRILIANKTDAGEMRQVTFEQGQALANRWGCAFMECSAKHNVNIERAFTTLLDEIERASEPEGASYLSGGFEKITSLFSCCSDSSRSSVDNSPSAAEIEAIQERWTGIAKISAWLTMLTALGGMCYAVWLGVNTSDSQFELLSYILFGFSFIVWLVSIVGLYGLRVSSADFLRVYAFPLGILVVSEVIVWILLWMNINDFSRHPVQATLIGAVAIIVQSVAALSGYKLSTALSHVPQSPYGGPSDYQGSSLYHSLYDS